MFFVLIVILLLCYKLSMTCEVWEHNLEHNREI